MSWKQIETISRRLKMLEAETKAKLNYQYWSKNKSSYKNWTTLHKTEPNGSKYLRGPGLQPSNGYKARGIYIDDEIKNTIELVCVV